MKRVTFIIPFFMLAFMMLLKESTAQSNIGNDSDGYKQADTELNNVYQQILKEYASDTIFVNQLRSSQYLWMKFRDAEMLVKYPPREKGYYGSSLSMCWGIYLEELTRSRIQVLRQWLDGTEEGDVCAGSVRMK
jgi:uncharacterized protein YecT (DUF1311 family)